jgi:hypothetical protein
MTVPYTDNTILRQLLGNPGTDNVKEELLTVACAYGDSQMEAITDKSPWIITDAYYNGAVGIAYLFAKAFAKTGSDVEAQRSEDFDEATKAGMKLKEQLNALGSSSSKIIILGEDDFDVEYFRCSPYGPGGGQTSEIARKGYF